MRWSSSKPSAARLNETAHPLDGAEALVAHHFHHRLAPVVSFFLEINCVGCLGISQRIEEPAYLMRGGPAAVGSTTLHHRLEAGHFSQAARRPLGQPAENAAHNLQVVGGNQKVIGQDVDSPIRLDRRTFDGGGRLAVSGRRQLLFGGNRQFKNGDVIAVYDHGALLGALLEQIGGRFFQHRFGLGHMAGNVGQGNDGRLAQLGFDHGQGGLACRHAPEVVQSQTHPLAQTCPILLRLLAEVLAEGRHDRVVHQFSQLHLLPMGVQIIDVGDRQNTDSRLGKEAFHRPGGPAGRRPQGQ